MPTSRPYPEVIDEAELLKQSHISDAEIEKDIADTHRALRELVRQASERLAFVAYLSRLRCAREAIRGKA